MAKKWVGRLYVGGGEYRWVGRFDTRRERDRAVAAARVEHDRRRSADEITCREYVERFLRDYERDNKRSSYVAARQGLVRFLEDFGDRALASVERFEAQEWAREVPRSSVPVVVTLFNRAVDSELLARNPFRGTTRRSKGRAMTAPPTAKELQRLLDACQVLKDYAPQMRALVKFAAYEGMRPGEVYALEWSDIDMGRMRIHVQRRVYAGELDTPKSNKSKLIALTPPARDALLTLPGQREGLVFRSKRGKRLSQPTVSLYWANVLAAAGLDFDFYLATKHWCVHYLFTQLGLSPRAIAAQMGWSLSSTYKMLETYGHADIGALDEIDAGFANNVVDLGRKRDAREAK